MTRNYCREIYEVWAGSEGIPMPETAPEAYLLHLVEQMRDIAKEGLRAPPQREWQDLTDEEIMAMRHMRDWTAGWTDIRYAREIEAKLREKNT